MELDEDDDTVPSHTRTGMIWVKPNVAAAASSPNKTTKKRKRPSKTSAATATVRHGKRGIGDEDDSVGEHDSEEDDNDDYDAEDEHVGSARFLAKRQRVSLRNAAAALAREGDSSDSESEQGSSNATTAAEQRQPARHSSTSAASATAAATAPLPLPRLNPARGVYSHMEHAFVGVGGKQPPESLHEAPPANPEAYLSRYAIPRADGRPIASTQVVGINDVVTDQVVAEYLNQWYDPSKRQEFLEIVQGLDRDDRTDFFRRLSANWRRIERRYDDDWVRARVAAIEEAQRLPVMQFLSSLAAALGLGQTSVNEFLAQSAADDSRRAIQATLQERQAELQASDRYILTLQTHVDTLNDIHQRALRLGDEIFTKSLPDIGMSASATANALQLLEDRIRDALIRGVEIQPDSNLGSLLDYIRRDQTEQALSQNETAAHRLKRIYAALYRLTNSAHESVDEVIESWRLKVPRLEFRAALINELPALIPPEVADALARAVALAAGGVATLRQGKSEPSSLMFLTNSTRVHASSLLRAAADNQYGAFGVIPADPQAGFPERRFWYMRPFVPGYFNANRTIAIQPDVNTDRGSAYYGYINNILQDSGLPGGAWSTAELLFDRTGSGDQYASWVASNASKLGLSLPVTQKIVDFVGEIRTGVNLITLANRLQAIARDVFGANPPATIQESERLWRLLNRFTGPADLVPDTYAATLTLDVRFSTLAIVGAYNYVRTFMRLVHENIRDAIDAKLQSQQAALEAARAKHLSMLDAAMRNVATVDSAAWFWQPEYMNKILFTPQLNGVIASASSFVVSIGAKISTKLKLRKNIFSDFNAQRVIDCDLRQMDEFKEYFARLVAFLMSESERTTPRGYITTQLLQERKRVREGLIRELARFRSKKVRTRDTPPREVVVYVAVDTPCAYAY